MLGGRAQLVFFAAGTLMFHGCGGNTEKSSSLDFSVHEVDRLSTRMSEGDSERPLDPERAFLLRTTCPKITRAEYRPESEGLMGVLQVWGTGIDESWGLVAWPDQGPIGRAQAKAQTDGSRRYAVGCKDCTLLLGMETEGLAFGCLGPGHSLRLESGRLERQEKPPRF